jgi:ATP-binding cassette subfamily F protein uup
MVVSHDRRFLDRVITRIIELDRGQLASYPGSFRDYKARKAQQLSDEAAAAARFDKRLAEEEVWIRKGIEARRTRNEGRVRRLEQLRRDRAARRERIGQVGFKLASGESSGELVAELEHVSVALGGRTLIRDFSTRIVRGDRIGLVGPNGAGKTTLLRVLLGELQVDSGKARLGTRLEIAYFDQFRAQLDPEARLTDVVSPGSDFVEIGGSRQHVIGYLSEFLFPPQRARSPVSALSGGERNRLLLARLFARPANLLVLDEPTNDLDIETLDLLESLLAEYKGTVLVVSHDREFLDNVTTQVIAFAGDGQLVEIAGGYSDWQRYRAGMVASAAETAPASAASAATARAVSVSPAVPAGRVVTPERLGTARPAWPARTALPARARPSPTPPAAWAKASCSGCMRSGPRCMRPPLPGCRSPPTGVPVSPTTSAAWATASYSGYMRSAPALPPRCMRPPTPG